MRNPSQSYYLHLESSFLSMVVDHVHGSIALVVEYGMYTITRPRTVKINTILISSRCVTQIDEKYAEDSPRRTYVVENLYGYTFAGILV